MKLLSFEQLEFGNWATYPKERGRYLIIYSEHNSPLYDYQLVYFRPESDGESKGFYLDSDCDMSNEVSIAWGWEPHEYMFLPNLLSNDGKYKDISSIEKILKM